MAKIITTLIVVIAGCIHYKGAEHVAGGDPFECEAKEAARLIEMGVAAEPTFESADNSASQSSENVELLAVIAAAETAEALTAIMPKDQPDDEIAAAFVARMTELEGA
jgi:hypothetical protein